EVHLGNLNRVRRGALRLYRRVVSHGAATIFSDEIAELHAAVGHLDQLIDVDIVSAQFDDDARQLYRQIDDPLGVVLPPDRIGAAIVVTGLVAGQGEADVLPAVEVEVRPTVHVVAVPIVARADALPAFALRVLDFVNDAAPVRVAVDEHAQRSRPAGNLD